jgi:GT2 family glycosyltransferase
VTAPPLTVVVPSLNGREMLGLVLSSLEGQTFRNFEIVVVDNGSDDGSVEYLHDEWPSVEVVALDRNHGFAAAVNRGIERTRSELVALVNNDMELDPGFLEELVAALRRHPSAGSATAKMLRSDDRTVIDGAGDVISWSGGAARRGQGQADGGRYDAPSSIFGACAGAAVYRRDALDSVGPFDEDFFAYLEDADWSFRAQLRGYSCRYVPGARAYHVGGATSGRMGDLEVFLVPRNRIALVLKNFPLRRLIRHLPVLLLRQLREFALAVRDGRGRTLLRAWSAAIRALPRTLAKRRAIQRSRRVSDRALRAVIPSDLPRRQLPEAADRHPWPG